MRTHRAWLVHGFNVWDGGEATIGRLVPYFEAEGWDVRMFRYGWTGLLGVRFGNKSRAKRLKELVRPGDIGVGHSNGCAVLHMASHEGAPFSHLTYVNPALDVDAAPAEGVRSVNVWHSPSDKPVRVAKFLWRHPWGQMGAKGYFGSDQRIRNYDKEHGFRMSSSKHSDVFTDPALLDYFGPRIATLAVAR